MPVVCIIPARYGSSRFYGKLLVPFRGKSILQRTFESALACPLLDQIYIATCDEEIARAAEQFGAQVLYTSSNCCNGTERIAEALVRYPHLQKSRCIVNIQGDHPTLSSETVGAVVQALQMNPGASIATAAYPSHEPVSSPHRVKCVFDQKGRALYFSRSPLPYRGIQYLHVGIYAYHPQVLLQLQEHPSTPLQEAEDLEQLKALELGYTIQIALVAEFPIGIDTPEDLQQLEKIS